MVKGSQNIVRPHLPWKGIQTKNKKDKENSKALTQGRPHLDVSSIDCDGLFDIIILKVPLQSKCSSQL